MANWGELPLISVAQQPAMAPLFYIPEIIQQMQEQQKIYQYAGKLDRFGLKDRVGQTWNITITDKVGTKGTNLGAGTKIAMTNIISYTIYGTILEMGNGVEMEKFLLNLSPSDIEGQMVRFALAQDITETLDAMVRDQSLLATTTTCYGGTYATVGYKNAVIFGTYANGAMTWGALNRLVTQARIQNLDSFDVPLFVHPFQSEDLLLQGTAGGISFTSIAQYTEVGQKMLFAGEIGKVGPFRIIPTNRVSGTLEVNGTLGTVQCADAFGFVPNTGVFFGWALPPEIRFEPDYQVDFNRVAALAWYGQGGARLGVDRHNFRLHTTVRGSISQSGI